MSLQSNPFLRQSFSADQLRNSVMFDLDRRLRGDAGEALLDEVLGLLTAREHRSLARRLADAERRRVTISTLLANLAATAVNRVDPDRFVAVPFSNNAYSRTGLSVTTMTTDRDAMLALGLIEGRGGIRRPHEFHEGVAAALLTRLRATARLRDLFEQHGIAHRSIARIHNRASLVVVDRKAGVPAAPPAGVAASLPILDHVNTLNADASIELPAEAWCRISSRWRRATGLERLERASAGDTLSTALFRSFKHDWEHGGRLYGGWWMGLPRDERPLLMINGEAVVEIDYGQLHPSILFARAKTPLDFDPYVLPGYESAAMRQLGKETFARLLNGTVADGRRQLRLRPKDRPVLPPELSERDYVARLRCRLRCVEQWLLKGEGLRLQREDSDLAMDVLGRMIATTAVILPVHDSFIVQERYGASLRRAMRDCYVARFGVEPVIKGGGGLLP